MRLGDFCENCLLERYCLSVTSDALPLLSPSLAGTQLDSISVPGPHQEFATFKLLVMASAVGPVRVDGKRKRPSSFPSVPSPASSVSSSRYTILASATEGSVVLKAGVPQNHFVSRGLTEYFSISASPDADLRYCTLLLSCTLFRAVLHCSVQFSAVLTAVV
jgi:hypothetical protein